MRNNKKIYICKHCKNKSDIVGVMQKEVHYYKFYLDTNQWEDLCGGDDVEEQEIFCLNCDRRIKNIELGV